MNDRLHEQDVLLSWYKKNQRKLPWRETFDPYCIWISEVMLQQTTVHAVIPFYHKFLYRFPDVEALANSSIEDVYSLWSGLGYYSRARNIHRAAQELTQREFPQNWEELIQLPGFGDYTSRAVTSIAFNQSVGVVDGNVIRFICRYHGMRTQWWKSREKKEIQMLSDAWVEGVSARLMNQALMEIGATICLPKNPLCSVCPLQKRCYSFRNCCQLDLPLSKPKVEKKIVFWEAQIFKKNCRYAVVENAYLPFLKKQWVFPGRCFENKNKNKNKKFNFKHFITKYDISVYVKEGQALNDLNKTNQVIQWFSKNDFKEKSPYSLLTKVIENYELAHRK